MGQLGMVGLGRMGGNMTQRLIEERLEDNQAVRDVLETIAGEARTEEAPHA